MTEELRAAAERLCLRVEDHYPMPGSGQTVEELLADRIAHIEAHAAADPARAAWGQANRERKARCRAAAEGPAWADPAGRVAALLLGPTLPDLALVAAEFQKAVDAAYAVASPGAPLIERSHFGPFCPKEGYEITVFALPPWLLSSRIMGRRDLDSRGLLAAVAAETASLFAWAERETGGHAQTGEPRWQVCRPVVEILPAQQDPADLPPVGRRRPTGIPCVHVWAYAVRPKPEPKEGDK